MTSTAPPPRRRVFISVGTRLTVPVVILVAAVALGAYFGLSRASRATSMRTKEAAVDMAASLTALSVVPAVVFGDDVEMRRAVDDLAKNPEVTDIELWPLTSASSNAPLASFHRNTGRVLARPRMQRERVVEADSVRATEPVVGPDGIPLAVLTVRLSTAREAAALSTLTRQTLFASLLMGAALALALVLVIRSAVVRPLARLQRAAQRLREGQVDQAEVGEKQTRTEDEVGQLAFTFAAMASAVRDREARLAVRNAELRLILDNAGQGFLSAVPNGTFLPERSAIIERWFGVLPETCTLWELVERIDPNLRAWTEVAWLQGVEGIFPLEVALDQLPKHLALEDRNFEFLYQPVLGESGLERVVIVVTDVTAEVERERVLAEQREFSLLVDLFVRDRRAFYDFWREACALVDSIVGGAQLQVASTRRDLHTLKGNARGVGLGRVASLCHSIEDSMAERGESAPRASDCKALDQLWGSLRQRMEPIMQGSTAFLELSEADYRGLLTAVETHVPFAELEALVRGLRNEPVAWRFARAEEVVAALAKKLGKSAPTVVAEHHDLRLPAGRFSSFWSVFSHLLSNAVDHGIESDDERRALGKAVPGRLRLSAVIAGGELCVEAEDDGRGIDWDALREKAAARGLPHQSRRDLERCLFSDGFSLKSSVSEISGRGVGLAALRSIVTTLGGRIEIESKRGAFTRFRVRMPAGSSELLAQTSAVASHALPAVANLDRLA